jgi:hypothetical protein
MAGTVPGAQRITGAVPQIPLSLLVMRHALQNCGQTASVAKTGGTRSAAALFTHNSPFGICPRKATMTSDVHAALDGHLAALDGLPPIAWENMQFDAPLDGSAYLRVAFVPGQSSWAWLGGGTATHERGVYQVGISAPFGVGSGEAEELADRVIAHFKRKQLTIASGPYAAASIVCTSLPTRTQAQLVPDEGRVWLAVNIPYLFEMP